MIKIKLSGQVFALSNRAALKFLNENFQQLNAHLQTHCFECDEEFTEANHGIQYAVVIPGQQGFICERCANNLIIQEFTVEDNNNND